MGRASPSAVDSLKDSLRVAMPEGQVIQPLGYLLDRAVVDEAGDGDMGDFGAVHEGVELFLERLEHLGREDIGVVCLNL